MTRLSGLSWALLVAALLAVLAPSFARSDNVHSVRETVAFDRIALSLRTFWAEQSPPEGPSLPTSIRPDPNFPLGTSVLFALPYSLGLDPVLGSRLITLFAALLAALALGCLVAALADTTAGVLAAAAIWGVPAFTRSAVVTGEAAPYTAALLGSAALLAWERKKGRPRRSRLLLAGLLLGMAVLFRLDAFALAPVWIVAVAMVFGLASAAIFSASALPFFACHLLVSWQIYGSPVAFARSAARVTQHNAAPNDLPLLLLLQALNEQLTLPLVVVATLAGCLALVAFLRGGDHRRSATVFAGILLAGTVAAYVVMTGSGAMEPRLQRYLVPLFALALGAALSFAWGRESALFRRGLVLAYVLFLLVSGREQALREARELVLPAALPEIASWLVEEYPGSQVRVSGYHPEMVVLSGLPETIIKPLPRGADGVLDVEVLARQRKAVGPLLVAFDGDPLAAQLLDNKEKLSLELVRSYDEASVYR